MRNLEKLLVGGLVLILSGIVAMGSQNMKTARKGLYGFLAGMAIGYGVAITETNKIEQGKYKKEDY